MDVDRARIEVEIGGLRRADDDRPGHVERGVPLRRARVHLEARERAVRVDVGAGRAVDRRRRPERAEGVGGHDGGVDRRVDRVAVDRACAVSGIPATSPFQATVTPDGAAARRGERHVRFRGPARERHRRA